jgi:hypothetical protein
MVASTWITPGCVQFLKNKKHFHTAWVTTGLMHHSKCLALYVQLIGAGEQHRRHFDAGAPMAVGNDPMRGWRGNDLTLASIWDAKPVTVPSGRARLRAGARNPLSRRDWQVRRHRFLLSGIMYLPDTQARVPRKD